MSKTSKFHTRLANQVLEYLVAADIQPGSHLAEPDLCDRFHVSRTPIRGALKLLSAQGYLEHVPRRGYFTSKNSFDRLTTDLPESEEESLYLEIAEDRISQRLPTQNSEADLLRRYPVAKGLLIRVLQRLLREGLAEKRPGRGWMFTPVLDSKQMHDESYRFRLAIEPLALLEESFELDEEEASKSAAKHERILNGNVAQITPMELFEINAEFHELLAAGSHNRFFLQSIQQQNRLRRFVNYHWTFGPQRVIETCHEHMEVLKAIRNGDMQWASSLLRRHLEVSSSFSPYSSSAEHASSDIQGSPERVILLNN